MLDYKTQEKIEKKVNSLLKDFFYIQDTCIDDQNEDEVFNIALDSLEDLGFKINTHRKEEMILKFADIWRNGTRLHIYIKKCDLSSIDDVSDVPYRKSVNYTPLLKECNFDDDFVVRTWYISIV